MTLTRTQRHNRRRRAVRNRRIKQYLIDRMKEPQFPLAKSVADELGDVAPGTMITLREFQRCLFRIADIRAGKIKRPTQRSKQTK